MFRHLSAAILASTALSFVAPSFAQIVPATYQSSSGIDYSAYDDLISKVAVVEKNRSKIGYSFLRDQRIDFFGNYIASLSRQDVSSLPENEQLAYWLNLQNAVAVHAITYDSKKVKSLKKLRGTAEAPGKLWTQPRVTIAGQNMSLHDIETKILTEFDDPNVIYGIYQGVRGAPSLNEQAYRGATVQSQLAKNAKQYINSKGVVSVKKDVVRVTPVFNWYQDKTIGQGDTALINHLSVHAAPKLKAKLSAGKSFKTSSLNYRVDSYTPPVQSGSYSAQESGSLGGSGGGYGS